MNFTIMKTIKNKTMNKKNNYMQKFFFLLMMGFSLCAVQACSGDDDESRVLDNGNFLVSGHEAVDLGLSVKWATCNVGASSPEDYGGYYAWGETEVMKEKDSYKWYKKNDLWDEVIKYDENKDGKTVLDPSDDVATVNWGIKWRMPTKKEIDELINKCAWIGTTRNNVEGCVIFGPSGRSIFLPAASERFDVYFQGEHGYYYSATLSENDSFRAYTLFFFNDGDSYLHEESRTHGFSVRPVTE